MLKTTVAAPFVTLNAAPPATTKGFVFGKCTRCGPTAEATGLTLDDILTEHIVPLNVPACTGAMISHITDKFTVPLGINAELGTI